MPLRTLRFVWAVLLSLGCGSGASASMGLIDGSEPESVLIVAGSFGQARFALDPAGDPLIRGRVDGRDYVIYFYGCDEDGRCSNLTFSASWESDHYTDSSMGDWNRTKRFGTAYLDAGGNPTLEMNVNLSGGVSYHSLKDSFDWWRLLMSSFAEYFGF